MPFETHANAQRRMVPARDSSQISHQLAGGIEGNYYLGAERFSLARDLKRYDSNDGTRESHALSSSRTARGLAKAGA